MNDLVVGCRTIKCYGWEKHYIDRIKELRDEQMYLVYKLNIIASFGTSFFQNTGIIAVLIILCIEWGQGKELFNDKIVPMLAMIYLVFFSTNMITYFGLSSLQTFLGILDRLASVFSMEENKVTRDTKCSPEDVSITVKDGTFS